MLGTFVSLARHKKTVQTWPSERFMPTQGEHEFWCTIRDSNPGHPD